MPTLSLHSPIGPLTLTARDGAIVALDWGWSRGGEETGLLALARAQLTDYFDGRLKSFRLPLAPAGSAFQRRVWQAMARIPHGQTESYADLARRTGSAPRAVGMACARNPIPVLIPCHRVVGSDGELHGYSGGEGIATKRHLLELEGALATREPVFAF